MKKENLEDYEVFYMELPQADYLRDIEIQDEYDETNTDARQGLSDEQVSEIARDSLDGVKDDSKPAESDSNNLFSDQTSKE